MSAWKGQPPYGFHIVAGRLVVDEDEAKSRRRLFELFLEHRKKGVVARKLNEEGYRTRRGAQWRDVQVARQLLCPSAVGRYPAGKGRSKAAGEAEGSDEEEYVPCPPLVSEEVWDKAQSILSEQGESKPTRLGSHAFSGLVVCSCGGKFMVPSDGKKFVCARCRAKIPIAHLDEAFVGELKSALGKRLQKAVEDRGEIPLDLEELARRWPSLSLSVAQQLARFLLDKIVIRKDRAQFHYRLSDSSERDPESEQNEVPTEVASLVSSGEPEWIRVPKAGEHCPYTGLSKTALGHLIYPSERNAFKPPVRSKSMKKPGKKRGVRLVHWPSLKGYLEGEGR